MNSIEFENKVIEMIDNYGAPENISEEIKNFLIQSGNIYTIIELCKSLEEDCMSIDLCTPKDFFFGNPVIGNWYCPSCHYSIFPNALEKLKDSFVWSNKSNSLTKNFVGPHCKECNTPMEYDEFM